MAIRGFQASDLAARAEFLEQFGEMTVERYLQRILVGHVLIHQRSIKETLGFK